MIKIISTSHYNELVNHCKEIERKNIELEAQLTINKTWVEIGDQKLEKAMVRIDDLLIIKHKHKSCQK